MPKYQFFARELSIRGQTRGTVPTEYTVDAFGATGDGVTDDTKAIQAAVDAASNAGGGTVFLPMGTYPWDGQISVPERVNIWGSGSGAKAAGGAALLALGATAQLRFGAVGSAGQRGGLSGNFVIDGADVATTPMALGRAVQRTFVSIDINRAVSDGLLIQEAQNCVFIGINVDSSEGHGITLDRGCGGNLFLRCESNENAGYQVRVVQTAASSGVYEEPTQNGFYHCIFEREHTTLGTLGCLYHGAGRENTFWSSIFAITTGGPHTLITLNQDGVPDADRVQFHACRLQGSSHASDVGIDANVGVLEAFLLRDCWFFNMGVGIDLASAVQANIDLMTTSGVTTPIQGSGSAATIRTAPVADRPETPAQITADQNNYRPVRARVWRLSSDASRTITGLAGTQNGKRLTLVNVGAFNIVLANQNAGSSAANQIITGAGADFTLLPDQAVECWYDQTTTRWRIVGVSA